MRVWPKAKCPVCDRTVVLWDRHFLRPHGKKGVACAGSHMRVEKAKDGTWKEARA